MVIKNNANRPKFLTHKAPITAAAHNIHKYFFIAFQRKSDDISCESSAMQRIHIAEDSHEISSLIFFQRKNEKKKKLKYRLLQFFFAL